MLMIATGECVASVREREWALYLIARSPRLHSPESTYRSDEGRSLCASYISDTLKTKISSVVALSMTARTIAAAVLVIAAALQTDWAKSYERDEIQAQP